MYPNHPNLLPAYYSDPRIEMTSQEYQALNVTKWVSKPIFGREGMGVFFSDNFTKNLGDDRGMDEFVRTTENNFG